MEQSSYWTMRLIWYEVECIWEKKKRESRWSMLCEKWCWLLSNPLHETQICKAICREMLNEPMSNSTETIFLCILKDDFQNSHIKKHIKYTSVHTHTHTKVINSLQ